MPGRSPGSGKIAAPELKSVRREAGTMPVALLSLGTLVGVAVGAVASLVAAALLVGYLLRRDPEAFLALARRREAETDPNRRTDLPEE
jgi:hypothetical protein